MTHASATAPLNLRAGEEVEVKSPREILGSLDAQGCLDALPFMPEMLAHCGRRFRVYKRAHKTCDTIDYSGGMRRMNDAVHLEDLRCDGAAHGDCEAGCLFFWKEAWLRRVGSGSQAPASPPDRGAALDEEGLARAARPSEEVFRCQATEMNRATTLAPRRDLRAVAMDVRSGNVRVREVLRWVVFDFVTWLSRITAYRALLWSYNRVARLLGGSDYPVFQGTLAKTPDQRLDLRPGELVRIKDRDAIEATLDTKNRNRGLSFDIEMVNFCGRQTRVLKAIEKIIDEKTGRMMRFPRPAIILEGVTCQAYYKNRGCPRSVFPFWREIWLERLER